MGDFKGRSGGNGRGFSSRGGFGNSFGPREMHKAVCTQCKKECQVPFKPTEGKPVFCKECYAAKKGF